jgi:hypothetical protein
VVDGVGSELELEGQVVAVNVATVARVGVLPVAERQVVVALSASDWHG